MRISCRLVYEIAPPESGFFQFASMRDPCFDTPGKREKDVSGVDVIAIPWRASLD